MVFRKVFCLFLLLYSGCILSGCGNQEQSEEGRPGSGLPTVQTGGIYRAPLLNNPKVLDPARAEDQYSAAVVYQLFDGLVKFSTDFLIIPSLAEDWRIEQDGTIYHFFLRKDAKFHNGAPVTSEDVRYSLSRLIRINPAPSILSHLMRIAGASEYRDGKSETLEGVKIIGDREFQIRLDRPYAPFLAALGMYQTRIVPRAEVERKGDEFARSPVGSGPFRFASWEDNRTVRLKRFENYYLGPAYLDEVDFIIYPGGQIEDVMADFLNRKLDEMPIYGKVRQQMLARQGINRIHRSSPSILFYGMNCEHPLLRNPAVRRALSLAVDREKLAATVYEGQFEPARTVLPPGMLGYNPQTVRVEDNLEKAEKELREVPLEGTGKEISLEIASAIQSPVARAELDFISQSWGKLGITVTTKFIPDWTEFEAYVKSPSMQIYRYAWFMDIPDPDNMVQVLFGSDSNVNYMHYRNRTVDQLLQTARTVVEPAKRAGIYQQIEEVIAGDTPIVPLVHLSVDQVYQSEVQGIQLNALAGHKALHQVWLSRREKN